MRPTKPTATIKRARRLRQDLSKPEAMLWRLLRGSPAGIRFRRQHAAGAYVLDFFCARANLAIEIDSLVHETGDRPDRDASRDRWLAHHHIETVRIPATEVLRNVAAVADAIVLMAQGRLEGFGKPPPSSLRDATSPMQVIGEDEAESPVPPHRDPHPHRLAMGPRP